MRKPLEPISLSVLKSISIPASTTRRTRLKKKKQSEIKVREKSIPTFATFLKNKIII